MPELLSLRILGTTLLTAMALKAHAGSEHYQLSGGLDSLLSKAEITLTPRPVPMSKGELTIDRELRKIEGFMVLAPYKVHVKAAGLNASTPAASYVLEAGSARINYDADKRLMTIMGATLRYAGAPSDCHGFFCRYQPATPDLKPFDLTLAFNEDFSSFKALEAKGLSPGTLADTLYVFNVSGNR